jgi:hypothetical protein
MVTKRGSVSDATRATRKLFEEILSILGIST